MEMRRRMVVVEHRHDDAEEAGYFGHVPITPSGLRIVRRVGRVKTRRCAILQTVIGGS